MNRELKMISLFTGAGGMDIGFHNAGFSTAVAIELDSNCIATFKKNAPNVPTIQGDICTITSEEILTAAKLRVLEAALVIGGPPCQSFSLAGKRLGMNDPRGRLLFEYFRVVHETLPQAFVLENVKGMMNWSGGRALEAIESEAAEETVYDGVSYSYKIEIKVLNAADFGVPQVRERVFIVGNRSNKPFQFPEPTHVRPAKTGQLQFGNQVNWATAGEALAALPPAEAPSEAAERTAGTIKRRIETHGY
jgi:DNA (cytosine-5)-methyltransferase 1